jgi:Asp-tRNA(Asn)/Glu-tRNA(Gln) amidotransferase A subunit family amidase
MHEQNRCPDVVIAWPRAALNAIVVWQIDQARERARAADAALARGERWGPLHGIPMTVKESFNVAGLPTTFGNPDWKNNIATGNAFLIDRLLQAGAIVFGKTNVPYMLADAQSYNDIYGTTNNPWGSDALTRRFVRRRGGDTRRRPVGPRSRQRHRRLLAQPSALQWRLRP